MLRRTIVDFAQGFLRSHLDRLKVELEAESAPWLDEDPIGPMVLVVIPSVRKATLKDLAYTYARRYLASAVEDGDRVSAAPIRFFRVMLRGEKASFREIPSEIARGLAARPSSSKALYRRRALAIHQLLLAEAERHPEMLESYADDLHVHDLACLEGARPGDTYVWILRKLGTHLIRMRPDHQDEDTGFLRSVLGTFGAPRHCYTLDVSADGGTLQGMNISTLLSRFHAA